MTMQGMVLNPKAAGFHKGLMQFYVRDSKTKKSYGPVQLKSTAVYFSNEISAEVAETHELPRLLDYIKSEKIEASCEIAKGYTDETRTIIMRSKDERIKDVVSEHHHLRFKPVGVTNKYRYSFNWPCQEVEISDELADCLKKQDELNQILRKIDDDYLMPLKMNDIEHNKAVSWLNGRRVKASMRSKVDSIVGNLREQANADKDTSKNACETLDAMLKKLDKNNCARIQDCDKLGALLSLESQKGMRFLKKTSNIEDYLDGICSFDIEVKHWWLPESAANAEATEVEESDESFNTNIPKKPTVYLISIASYKGDFVGGEFDIGKNYLENKFGRRAEYVCFHNDEKALIKWAGDKLREIDPLIIVTQNGLNYDYETLARRGAFFRIGCDNSLPEKMSQLRGAMDRKVDGKKVSKMKHPSALDFDLYLFAKNHLGFAVPDFKLETLAELAHKFFGAIVGYTKSHTYEQQKTDVELAQHDLEIAAGLALYGGEDSSAQLETAKPFIRIALNIAKATGCEIFTAFNESKRKIVAYAQNKMHYSRYDKPKSEYFQKAGQANCKGEDADDEDDEQSPESGLSPNKLKKEMYWSSRNQDSSKGFFKNILVCHLPLHNSLPAAGRECRTRLVELAGSTQNQLEKIIYHRMADEFMSEPLTRILQKNDFGLKKYSAKNFEELDQRIRNWLSAVWRRFGENKILNVSDGMVFVDNKQPEAIDSLVRDGLLVPWSYADIISVGKEKVIYNIGGELLSTGVDIPSLKRWQECDAPKDYTPNFQIKAVRQFVEDVFADKTKALIGLAENAKLLATNSIPAIDYLKTINCKELPKNMSDAEQNKRRAKVIEKFGLKVDEPAIFGIFDNGNEAGNGNSNGNGNEDYARYDPLAKSFGGDFSREFVPFTKLYQDEIFGINSKGTRSALWQIASAVFLGGRDSYLKDRKAKRNSLMNIMYGKGTEEDIKLLASAQP